MAPAPSRRHQSRPSGTPRRLRRERHRPEPDRRQLRRDLRRHRRAVRRRMAAPPPPPLTEDDDGPAGSTVRAARGTLRTRWKVAVAALPLLFAVALFLATVLGGGLERGVPDAAEATEIADIDASTATAAVAGPGGIPAPAPVPDTGAPAPPVPPAGHRAVAVRFSAPDAVDLVAAGDRIDVVGLDGDVLATDLEVLQDRSTGQAGVLVVAVPAEQAPELAAVAAAQDLTLLVTPTAG
ncbi:hypothetical protein ABDK96_09315 [Citricoccus nitrophenolicus]|uniref:Flp pilus assembly protein RcpC/CpaB domain-containing protein n=1 Tax=Citricoccus nitrophenolicus TaxID=863575 RepID=A0ABV0II87_9MICC